MKKIPMRMCIITREKLPKKDLIRVVKTIDGIVVDTTGKLNGKGCYLKKELEVIELAQKRKILNSILETNVEESIYEELKAKIN